jgi:hypothetical protein
MREHPPEYDIADREEGDDIIARGDIVSLNGREVKVYDFEEEIVYVNEAGEPSKSLAVYHYFIDDFSGDIDEVPKQYVQSLEVGNFLNLADDY